MNVDKQNMLPIGTMLRGGCYRVDEYLASGGFGNTYVVTNVQFNERLALKEFFMKGINQREGQTTVSVSNTENREQFDSQLEKFKKEARRLRKLENGNIVRVHDLFEENGTAYYVMDLIDGESLAAKMKRQNRPLAEAEVMDLLPQVLNALKGIHAQQIWHLDLKPGNIMVDKEGHAVLIDFGASKQRDVSHGYADSTTAMPYTLGFAPAEQMEGDIKRIGPWTDFYALGATIYNLLTKQQPPSSSNIMAEGAAAFHFPPSISSKTRQLVIWLMNPQSTSRPQSVEAIKQRIELNTSQDTVIHKVQKTEKSKKSKKKKGCAFATCGILAVLFLLLSIGLGGFGWYYYHHSKYAILNGDTPPSYSAELVELANDRNADAQYYLGLCYYTGDGVMQNYEEAVKWYRKAAEQTHVEAQYALGMCYYDGNGVSKDANEAVYWLRKAVDQDHAKAQDALGECYFNGFGVSEDDEKAVYWYRKSAEQGYAIAQFDLGYCYKNGFGVNQDYTEAVRWYRNAAEQGYAVAQYYLGLCYAEGKGVSQDYQEAVDWYHKAAEQGFDIAQNEMGECYYYGHGVDQDYASAVIWYWKAAEQENSNAQVNLGICFAKGYGVDQDYTEAAKWYRKAAEQGNVAAQYGLGECYYYGNGVSQNYYEAVNCYREAAIHGFASAQNKLGRCYYKGNGVAVDYTEAVKWFRKAAERGDANAQFNLGTCYENGLGVTQSADEAIEWYNKAAEQGNEDAIQQLEKFGIYKKIEKLGI